MSKIGVEMKGFQAQAVERDAPAPEGLEARTLYGAPARADRSDLVTLVAVAIVGLAAAAAGYLAIAGYPWSG